MYALWPTVAATMSDTPTGSWPAGFAPDASMRKIAALVALGSPPPNMYVCAVDLRRGGVVHRKRQLTGDTGAGAVDQHDARHRRVARVEAADRRAPPAPGGHGRQLHGGGQRRAGAPWSVAGARRFCFAEAAAFVVALAGVLACVPPPPPQAPIVTAHAIVSASATLARPAALDRVRVLGGRRQRAAWRPAADAAAAGQLVDTPAACSCGLKGA